MSKNIRLRLEFIIGTYDQPENSKKIKLLANQVCLDISTIVAGCTFWYSNGFWSKNGNQFLENYSEIEKQINLHIHVSILKKDEELFMTFVKDRLRFYKNDLEISIESVHLEKSIVEENHFLL